MKDQAPISRSEYAVLSPVERHAKLVELYQLLPKLDPNAEWLEAMDQYNKELKVHNEALENGSESREEFLNYFYEKYLSDRDIQDALREKGDQERERRLNSEDKQHIAGEVARILEFSPTTDEFKKTVIEFFDYSYDNGTEDIDKSNHLSHAILVKNAESGGFFNQQNACDIEVLAYRERKSWLGMTIYWNRLLDSYKEKELIPDEMYNMMHREVNKEEVMFLDKWEQAIKNRYHIEEV